MVLGSMTSGEDVTEVMLNSYAVSSIFLFFGVISNLEFAMFLCALLGGFLIAARNGGLSNVFNPWFDYRSMAADGVYLPVAMALGNLLFFAVMRIAATYKSARVAEHFAVQDSARTEFLQSVTHEIKSPLNGILGCIELLSGEAGNLTIDQKEQLEVISHSGAVLSLLVNNVLSKEGTSAASHTVILETRDLRLFFADIFKVLRKLVYKADIEFVLQLDDRLPHCAVIPASMLAQVILNLGMNALKHALKGKEICLAVEFEVKSRTLICEVRDRGPGVKDEGALFAPSKIRMTSTSGTGLGLHICRQLTRSIGATIGYRPNGAKGSVFFVHLPVEADLDSPPNRIESTSATEKTSENEEETTEEVASASVAGTNGNVAECEALLVDDNKVNIKVLTNLLTKRLTFPLRLGGTAEDGAEALCYLMKRKTCDPLIVFMDIQMPRMDGNQCAKHWRQLEASLNLSSAFLVAVSAGHATTTSGLFDAVLPKPIQLLGLTDLVHRCRTAFARNSPRQETK